MERLDNKDKIINLIKSKNDNKSFHLFQIHDENNHLVIRTVTVFKTAMVIEDYVYNDKHTDVNDESFIIPAIQKYSISIPISLFKSCSAKDKNFIVYFDIVNKMIELDRKAFIDSGKPVKWFIKSISIIEINKKIKILEGDD